MSKKFERNNPFADDNPLVKEYKRIYGEGVEPIPVLSIRPDLRQPRRVIPASVRGQWDGDPAELPEVLSNWHQWVEEKLGQPVDIGALLRAMGDGEPELSGDPVIDAYARLVSLAASIYRDGLEQPIAVVRVGNDYRIVWGERRWVAFALLTLHVDGRYDAIPAVVKPKADVWQQAAENGARAPLNAIGMARQLALLIMDMYAEGKRERFDEYDVMVLPGECDRKYYAQVANGNVYRIPKGMGQRVLDVTGLTSMERVRNYRALLSIPDGVWQKADEQSWSERAIRDYLDAAELTQSEALTSQHTVAQPTVSDADGVAAEGETALRDDELAMLALTYAALGNGSDGWVPAVPVTAAKELIVQARMIERGYLETSRRPRPIDKKLMLEVRITSAGITAYLAVRPIADDPLTLHQAEEDEELAGQVDGDNTPSGGFRIGDWVQLPSGEVARVRGVSASGSTVYLAGDLPGGSAVSALRLQKCHAPAPGSAAWKRAGMDTPPASGSPLDQYPKGCYVWHQTQGRVGEVIAYDRVQVALMVADPALPDSQPLEAWHPYLVTIATAAQVNAARKPAAPLFTQPRPTTTEAGHGTRQTSEENQDPDDDALGAAGVPLAEGAGGETTTAVLDAWEDETLPGVLKFLASLAEDTTRLRLIELQKVSRAEIAAFAPLPGSWERYVGDTERLVLDLISTQITALSHYYEHLRDVGRQLEAQYRDDADE